MSTEAGFLAEIRDNPGDDLPRLVYADWPEDNGESDRAEFIRTQIQLAALAGCDPARFDLEERALDLLAEHRPRWLAHLPKWKHDVALSFRRGIPESVALTPFLLHVLGEELTQQLPLTHVKLTNCQTLDGVASLD